MLKGLLLSLVLSIGLFAQTGINKSLVFTAGDSISAAVCLTPGSYPVGMWSDSLTSGSTTVHFKVATSTSWYIVPDAAAFNDLTVLTDTTSYIRNIKVGKFMTFPVGQMSPLQYPYGLGDKTEARYVWLKAVLPVKQTVVSKSINIRLGQ